MIVFNNRVLIQAALLLLALTCFLGGSAWAQTDAPVETPGTNIADTSVVGVEPSAQPDSPTTQSLEESSPLQTWNFHMQTTTAAQIYPSFRAKYSGPNSLPTSTQGRETVSVDLYGGFRLSSGAELHVDALMWQGFGLGNTVGIDDSTNGEAYKAGTGPPRGTIARLYIRQTIGLGGERENVLDDQQTLAGTQNISRLTLTIGRFGSKDIFDNNSYANDPRTQFMNWALMANVAWDYPSDSLGYTTGVAIELNQPKWALRYGFFQLPSLRNGFTAESQLLTWPNVNSAGDGQFWQAWGMVVEPERRYTINARPGAVRFLAYLNQGEFGNYQAALSAPGTDISLTHALRRTYGFGLNIEQAITKNIGVFSRLGWNDGHNEAWMFTDVNHSGSLGVSVKGEAWHRPDDTIGVAGVVSGISHVNEQFLAAGGVGILDGDGTLNYSTERVLEIYYDREIVRHLNGTLDYQFIANPAFNKDRGPVSVFGARLHFEF